MQTAPGEAVQDGSDSGAGGARAARRRLPFSPTALLIAGVVTAVSVGLMLIVLFNVWPPRPTENRETISETWYRSRTATPAAQHAAGLQIEKLGGPRREGQNVVVRLRVTNKVMLSPPVKGTPTPNAATPVPAPVTVYNGVITVIFYNEQDGKQEIIGGGVGNVTDLAPGASKEIEVLGTAIRDFSEATQYAALPDSVWTDQDPVKLPEGPSGGNASPSTPAP